MHADGEKTHILGAIHWNKRYDLLHFTKVKPVINRNRFICILDIDINRRGRSKVRRRSRHCRHLNSLIITAILSQLHSIRIVTNTDYTGAAPRIIARTT